MFSVAPFAQEGSSKIRARPMPGATIKFISLFLRYFFRIPPPMRLAAARRILPRLWTILPSRVQGEGSIDG
jgi:hypothetical protein